MTIIDSITIPINRGFRVLQADFTPGFIVATCEDSDGTEIILEIVTEDLGVVLGEIKEMVEGAGRCLE